MEFSVISYKISIKTIHTAMERQHLQRERFYIMKFPQKDLSHQASACSSSNLTFSHAIRIYRNFLLIGFMINVFSIFKSKFYFHIYLIITMAANSDELDEKAKPPVIQQKGRFKVTSENVCLEKVLKILILMLLLLFGLDMSSSSLFRWHQLLHCKRVTACR